MKIIKAMIKKHRTPTETGFEYPDGWDATKINVVAYEDSDNMGDVEEYCVALVHDDEYAKELIGNAEGRVIEIDETTANTLGDKCKPQQLTIDEEVLPELLLAIAKPFPERTKQGKKMLDPDVNVKGIRKTPKFDVKRWYPE